MRDLQLRASLWVQRKLEFTHKQEANVEETFNEATFEWQHIVEHAPHVVGTIFS